MEMHQGQIIEKIIRRNGHSITNIARLSEVNRRSVYNWFNQKHLKPDVIIKIGRLINHDFSKELPDLFTPDDFVNEPKKMLLSSSTDIEAETNVVNHWKDKYIDLLERYNTLIVNNPSVMVHIKSYVTISVFAILIC
jgi:hypothetical protein